MTFTLEQVLKATEVINRLAQHRFPAGKIKTAYWIAKTKKALESESALFQAERKRLIEDMGTHRPATIDEKRMGSDPVVHEVQRDSPAWPLFVESLNELLKLPVEIVVNALTLDDLNTVELSANELDALDPFFEPVPIPAVKESIDG